MQIGDDTFEMFVASEDSFDLLKAVNMRKSCVFATDLHKR